MATGDVAAHAEPQLLLLRPGYQRAFAQLRALTAKTLIVLRRRRGSSLLYMTVPSLVLLGLFLLHTALVEPSPVRDGQAAPLRVRKCEVFDLANQPVHGAACTTALFAPVNANTTAIMRRFAAASGLTYGVDVVGVANARAVAMQIAQRPGTVDSGIIFRPPRPSRSFRGVTVRINTLANSREISWNVDDGTGCVCSGATSSSGSGGADCTSYYQGRPNCYTRPGACGDGKQSAQIAGAEWSFMACEAATFGTHGYADYSVNNHILNLAVGEHTFNYFDSNGDGWHGGYWSVIDPADNTLLAGGATDGQVAGVGGEATFTLRPGAADLSLQVHSYELWANYTFANTFGGSQGAKWSFGQDEEMYRKSGIQGHYAAVHQAIDAAVIGHLAGLGSSADIQLDAGRFPELVTPDDLNTSEGKQHELIKEFADTILTIGCALSAMLVMTNIATEKDAKLLAALRQVGLHEWTYWTSWLAAYLAPCCIAAVMYTVVGNALGIILFTHCSVPVHVVTMFLFLQSFVAQLTFLASFVSKQRNVLIVGFLIVATTAVMMAVLKEVSYHYGEASPLGGWLFCTLMPPFHFYRVFTAVAGHIDPMRDTEFKIQNLGDATDCIPGSYDPYNSYCGDGVVRQEYSAGTSLLMQVMLVFLYNLLAWWAGQAFASDEGSTRRAWFCVLPSYWGCYGGRRLVLDPDGDSIALEQSNSSLEQSVRIWKLSKLYDEKEALTELTMKIESSRCCALLGQNGTTCSNKPLH